jgi:hypothetical protein
MMDMTIDKPGEESKVKKMQEWRADRFNPRGKTTTELAVRNTVGYKELADDELKALVKTLHENKADITALTRTSIQAMLIEAALACGMSFVCPYTNDTHLCTKMKHIRKSWRQDGSPLNQLRVYFVFYFFGTEQYLRLYGLPHQDWVETHVMLNLKVRYAARGAEPQKSAIKQLYAVLINEIRGNTLSYLHNRTEHAIQVRVQRPANCNLSTNWRRNKNQFFVIDSTVKTKQTWHIVSSHKAVWLYSRDGKNKQHLTFPLFFINRLTPKHTMLCGFRGKRKVCLIRSWQ